MKINYFIIPLITVLVASIGGLMTSRGMNWYETIHLPSWTPKGSFIGTVWTLLFVLATISALIVWNTAFRDNRFWLIVILFLANAVLNVFWSFLFFNQHLIGLAVFGAGLLGLSVVALILLVWPVSVLASVLLIPYALWVGFATYLTYAVWTLN